MTQPLISTQWERRIQIARLENRGKSMRIGPYAGASCLVAIAILAGIAIWSASVASPNADQLVARIDRILRQIDSIEDRPSDSDAPWLIAHHLLAFGREDVVVAGAELRPSIFHLVHVARGIDGGSLFSERDNSLLPFTDPLASQIGQDHRNQILADIALVTVDDIRNPAMPRDLTKSTFERMLGGAWQDYSLNDEPSWTLIAYTYYLPILPAPRESVLDRMSAIVDRLTGANPSTLACAGAHANMALAVCRASPYAASLTGAQKQRLEHRLNYGKIALIKFDKRMGGGKAPEQFTPRSSSIPNLFSIYGHSFEWLSLYLPPGEWRSGPLEDALVRFCVLFEQHRQEGRSDRGGYYHAVHALRMVRAKLVAH